jgi:hypothetical protein
MQPWRQRRKPPKQFASETLGPESARISGRFAFEIEKQNLAVLAYFPRLTEKATEARIPAQCLPSSCLFRLELLMWLVFLWAWTMTSLMRALAIPIWEFGSRSGIAPGGPANARRL